MAIALERGYRYEVTDTAIVLTSDSGSCSWTGGAIDTLIATLNDGGDHLLVVDFENVGGNSWVLKTSIDGAPYVNQGTQSGCDVLSTDSDPRVELNSAESDAYIDEAAMWVNPTEFTSQQLADMYALGNSGLPLDDWDTFTTTTAPPVVPHPADTGPGSPNWRINSTEILSYANAFLTDDDARFPGISPSNRSAYVLRGAAIYLANFQARYEDVGTAEPIDSSLHPARWQELPDL